MKKSFEVMEACAASAKDFIDTVLFCMKEDEFEDDAIESYKEYLLAAHEMHYNTDIGEQGENITKYLNECNYYDDEDLTLLQEEEQKITKWLKENNYADECIGAGFEPIEGHQGRAIDFEYNGNIDELDVNELSTTLAENVIDDRFYVRVFTYNEKAGEVYKNVFCVEIWLTD